MSAWMFLYEYPFMYLYVSVHVCNHVCEFHILFHYKSTTPAVCHHTWTSSLKRLYDCKQKPACARLRLMRCIRVHVNRVSLLSPRSRSKQASQFVASCFLTHDKCFHPWMEQWTLIPDCSVSDIFTWLNIGESLKATDMQSFRRFGGMHGSGATHKTRTFRSSWSFAIWAEDF